MKNIFGQAARILTATACVALCAGLASADVKIRSKSSQGGSASENTTYIKGRRQRMEMAGGMMISITQCDLERSLQLSPPSKTYIITPFNQPAATGDRATARPAPGKGEALGGLVTMTVTSRDTGERKQIFGRTARRYTSTMTTESSPDACSRVKTKMEIDAWYIDAAFALDCDMSRAYQNYGSGGGSGCQDRYDYKQVGQAPKGYPVWTKTAMFDESGKATFTVEQEVVEISESPLDASLFDVPAGYREVKTFSELISPAASDYGSRAASDNSSAEGSGGQTGSSAVGPKREGVKRLGLAVKTGSVEERMNASELAAAVRNTLMQYLKSPSVEVVPAGESESEAKAKGCDFVIFASVEHKKGGGAFGKLAGGVAALGGYGGSTAGAAAGGAASASVTVAEASAGIKAKDQLTLDLRIQPLGAGAPAVTREFKARAQSNGEDIISPLAEQAAQVILIEAAKK